MLESFFEVGRNNKTELNLKGTKKKEKKKETEIKLKDNGTQEQN